MALPLVRVGETVTLRVPHALAYGSKGKPPTIPPSATLTFELELVTIVENAGEQLAHIAGRHMHPERVWSRKLPPCLLVGAVADMLLRVATASDEALIDAASVADSTSVVRALQRGANVNAVDRKGWSALHHAADAGAHAPTSQFRY